LTGEYKEMIDVSEENNGDNIVVDKKMKHSYKYKVFVHVFDQCTQDSEKVVAILNDVLCRVKETDPWIKNAFIRSDNAGCYHSANTLVSAKQVSERTGISIRRIDFCDPQGGKGSCDHYAAVIKSNVRRYLNENHNVTTASEFVEACHSHKGVNGVHALNCRIESSKLIKSTKCTIKQITNYYNFEYQSKGLLVNRSWNIGSGLLIPWSQLNRDQTIYTLTFSELKGFFHDWVETKERSNNELMDVDDCVTHKGGKARLQYSTSTSGVQAEYRWSTAEYKRSTVEYKRSTVEYSEVQAKYKWSTSGVQWSTSTVQMEHKRNTSIVQMKYR
jgi:hypothetical protein